MQNKQVVTAYEQYDMTPELIAEQFDLEPAAVIACLLQSSPKYRKQTRAAGAEPESFEFNDTVLHEANNAIISLMRHSEDDHLRFKCARYIRDDKKGRLDLGKALDGMRMNVLNINLHMREAQDALEAARNGEQPKQVADQNNAIDV